MATAVALRRYQNYIDGRFVDAQRGKTIPVENPSTGQVISEVPDSSIETPGRRSELLRRRRVTGRSWRLSSEPGICARSRRTPEGS